ncbi:hypothetical protein SLEP1_g48070 [Rubroshorea leprosula]|uniref:Uncharacterized protein n=1 Tax=Rubroshorea leprosula TaxID=152421 RepID=A0AAV5LTB9_9ROSI|nr:hypothetical protein SLEP1_g48070 [Rubroshorea leprosula]
MESVIAPVLESVVGEHVDCHRNFQNDVDDLRKRVAVLKRRRNDRVAELQIVDDLEKQVKEEVEGWLEDARKVIEIEMPEIEEQVQNVSYLSRGNLGRRVRQKIQEVREIYDRGSFPQGLVIERSPAIGITLPIENMVGEVNVKEKIWEYLMGHEVGIIGVCGIGGVGKTTVMKYIHNELLNEAGRFEKVVWVTVSHPLNVFRLQDDIARAMNTSLSDWWDELNRASRLMKVMKKVKYALILDDVWDKFTLQRIGIPEPTMENGCKIVITSRSIDVCNYLRCEVVKVPPLPEEESLNLFLDMVGQDVLRIPNLEDILKFMVAECAGLPLAIVVIAGSMRGVQDISEWRDALRELRQCMVDTETDSEDEIFNRLKFSYDRQPKNSSIQECFLYCSLTGIEVLPNSICNLECLTALILCGCECLERMPSLSKLKALKKLDLDGVGLRETPEGIEMLENLEYLDLSCPNLRVLPRGKISKLFRLQYLRIVSTEIRGEEEVVGLKMLEWFEGRFDWLKDFSSFVSKLNHFGRPSHYFIKVGGADKGEGHWKFNNNDLPKQVILIACEIGEKDEFVLPDDLQDLRIESCNAVGDISIFQKDPTQLRTCALKYCQGIVCVVSLSSSSSTSLTVMNNLEVLTLERLPHLRNVVQVEKTRASLAPTICPHNFSNLKQLRVYNCLKLKKLFPCELLQGHGLQNLELIDVKDCEGMEEIIGWEKEEEGNQTTTPILITLPKLRTLKLNFLSELKRIWPEGRVMACESLNSINISFCPKVKRIPLCLGRENAQPSLLDGKFIYIDNPKEWWESLEWENPDEIVLVPFLKYYERGPSLSFLLLSDCAFFCASCLYLPILHWIFTFMIAKSNSIEKRGRKSDNGWKSYIHSSKINLLWDLHDETESKIICLSNGFNLVFSPMLSLMDVMAVICLPDHWYHVFSMLAEGLSNLMAASLLEELAIGDFIVQG